MPSNRETQPLRGLLQHSALAQTARHAPPSWPPPRSVLTAFNMAVSKATKLMRQLLRQHRWAGYVRCRVCLAHLLSPGSC